MMNNHVRFTFGVAAAVFLCAGAHADVTFSDTEFANTNWASEIVTFGAGGTTSGTQTTGGNPGFGREVTNNLIIGGTIYGFHRYGTTTATRYDPPISGAINTVDFKIDSKWLSGIGGLGHGITIGAKQGTVVFRAGFDVTGSTGLWETHAATGFVASDFAAVNGSATAIDFSATGAPIRFGFVVSNAAVNESYTNVVLYDNFQVVVHNLPAPGGAALLAGGALAALRRRRAPAIA